MNLATQTILLYLMAAALFSLGVWMLGRYQRSPAVLYYAFFLFGLTGIAAIQSTLFLGTTADQALMLSRIGYAFGALTFAMLLMFSFYYPIPNANLPRQIELIWAVPVAFFLPFVFNPTFLASVSVLSSGTKELPGPSFWIFPAFVASYVIWTLINLVKKLQHVKGREQQTTRVFIWALSVTSVVGLVFDVLLPSLGWPRIPVGIYSSSVLFGLSAYIVTRR